MRQRLSDAVTQARVPAWNGEAVRASRRAQLVAGRRFGRALRLARNIAAFDGVIAQEPLVNLLIDRLLQQQVCLG